MAEVQSAHGTFRPQQSGYADVSGVHMSYEVYGGGSPLVLLHGGMLTIELNFAQLIPTLAGKHQGIGVELQGHGRTADIDRAITPAALASDVVGLLDHLGIDRAHVFGHSMGGAAVMELAINRPDRVRARCGRLRQRGTRWPAPRSHRSPQAGDLPADADPAGLHRLPAGLPSLVSASRAL
jgi:pimeloyl-ACP methyl ester carboxylesterase